MSPSFKGGQYRIKLTIKPEVGMQVGIVGAGNIARFHIEGYAAAGAQVVGVADVDRTKAESLAKKVDACAYAEYAELLARQDVNAVSICLPNNLHYRAASDALRAGKHVICEKPMTTTLSDARELVKLAVESGRCVQVAYMKRFIPAFQIAREALGEIGNVLSATVKVFHWFPEENWATADKAWGLQKEGAGGGPLVHSGSHIIDVLNWWFGRISEVSAKIRYRPQSDFDDYTAATLRTTSGVTIFFEDGWLPLSRVGYFKDGWDERIEVTGDRGRIELFSTWWDRPEMSPFVRVYKEGEPMREYYAPSANPFVSEIKQFVKACANGGGVSPNAVDGLAVQEVIEAIYRSDKTGAPVRIEDL